MTNDELAFILCTEHCEHKKMKDHAWCEECIQELLEEHDEDLLELVAVAVEESEINEDVLELASVVRAFKR